MHAKDVIITNAVTMEPYVQQTVNILYNTVLRFSLIEFELLKAVHFFIVKQSSCYRDTVYCTFTFQTLVVV